MKLARAASLIIFAVAAAFASDGPAGSDNADVMDVLRTFQFATQNVLPQITLIAQGGNKTQVAADVKPLLDDLTAAAHAAVGSLKDIKLANGTIRPVDPAVAALVSSILKDITTTLHDAGVSSKLHPEAIAALDDPLSTLLDVLESILRGTLGIVGVGLAGLSVVLLLVGLGLVLGALGL